MRDWTLLCDFDGTIAVDDVTDALLERFAAPEWRAVEARWRAGDIGSRDCMQQQVAMLDASPEQLDALLDALPIDPAFPAFAASARRHGIPILVVSDGLDYAIHRMLARHGLDGLPVRANRLLRHGARGWRLLSPHADTACAAASGTCKCAIARNHGRVLLVGDGQSDFCLAERADFVFAKHRLIAHCRGAGIAHRPIVDFADACALLEILPALVGSDASPLPEPLPLRVRLA